MVFLKLTVKDGQIALQGTPAEPKETEQAAAEAAGEPETITKEE